MIKSKDTKRYLIEAAFEEYAEKGLHRTSLGTIARRANSSAPLILYHFKNLDSLFQAVVLLVVERGLVLVRRYTEGLESGEEKLIAYLNAMIDWMGNDPKHSPILLQFYHNTCLNPEYQKINDEIVQAGLERIRSYLPENKKHLAKAIQELVTGALITLSTTNERSNPYAVRSRLVDSVKKHLE